MEVLNTPEAQIKLSHARRLMSDALDILDKIDTPIDAVLHLDLAINRLENHLGLDAPGAGGAQELRAALERELLACEALDAVENPWELQLV
jgi:hypothetical protein